MRSLKELKKIKPWEGITIRELQRLREYDNSIRLSWILSILGVLFIIILLLFTFQGWDK